MQTIEHIIKDPVGIHARPAAALVNAVSGSESAVTIDYNGKVVDAKGILGIMQLGAKSGETITFQIDGNDELKTKLELEQFLSENL